MGILGQRANILSRASLIAGFVVWLICGPNSKSFAANDVRPADASAAEQRLLGDDDEAARFAACQPFTREIAVEGAVEGSFDASLAAAGMPAAAMLEVRRALAASIDLGREIAAGDHFYIRYKQMFTAEGAPIGVGSVTWAEIVTRARGTIAIHRFRPPGGIERFWLANGEAATAPSMRMPLDVGDRLLRLWHARRSVRPTTAQCEGKRRSHGWPRTASRRRERQGFANQRGHRPRHCPGPVALGPALGAAARGFTRCSCMRASISRHRPARRYMLRPTAS